MLVDVVTEYAAELLRPAAADADKACEAPVDVLKAGLDRPADPRRRRRAWRHRHGALRGGRFAGRGRANQGRHGATSSSRPTVSRRDVAEVAEAAAHVLRRPDTHRGRSYTWISTYTSIRDGELEHVSDDVPPLLGRPATSFADAVGS